MNRILHWLTMKLSRPTAAETNEQPGSDYEERDFSKEDNPGEPVTVREAQTNIDDLMPGIYAEATGDTQSDDDTQPFLEIIENSSRASEMSEGFDPYNTGEFKGPKK